MPCFLPHGRHNKNKEMGTFKKRARNALRVKKSYYNCCLSFSLVPPKARGGGAAGTGNGEAGHPSTSLSTLTSLDVSSISI